MKKGIVMALGLLVSGWCFSQDKVVMLTGKVLEGKVLSYDEAYIHYTYASRKGTKNDMLERYRVYSVIDSSNKETVLYIQDSSVGNFMTEPEIKMFVKGEQDAMKNFRCPGYKTSAFLLSLGFSLLDTYKRDSTEVPFFNGFFRGDPTIAQLIPPFAIPILAGLPPVSIRLKDVSEKNHLLSEPYLEGFERIGKQRRKFSSLWYSLAGSAVGIGLYYFGKAIQ